MLFKNNIFKSMLPLFIFLILGGPQLASAAEQIQFSEDILPTESVIPRLDSQDMVIHRAVDHDKRFEAKADLMWVLDELFSDGKLLGVTFHYHLNNDLGLGFKYYQYSVGFNQYKEGFDSKGVRIERGPQPKSIMALSLVNRILYGKISIGKQKVLPLTVDVQYDLGLNKYGTKNLFYSAVSLSNKLFVKKHIIIDLSYGIQFHDVINPVSVDVRQASPVAAESEFKKKFQVSQAISIGLGYLF